MVELTIDGAPVQVPDGATILDACRAAGDRDADAVLSRDADAGQRLSRLRRRARGIARARSRLRAPRRSRHGHSDRFRAGAPQPQDGARVSRFFRRPLDRAGCAALLRALWRRPAALRCRAGDGRAAGQDRQRALRSRLREVHSLLQVRRGVRRRRPEHVCHRRRRARLRRAHLDGIRRARCPTRPASTAGTASASARRAR